MRRTQWRVAWPLTVILLVLCAVLFANKGMPLEERPSILSYLSVASADSGDTGTAADLLIAYDPSVKAENACALTLTGALDQMRIRWRSALLGRETLENLSGVKTLMVCSQDLSAMAEFAPQLMDWVASGGRLALMMAPKDNDAFDILCHKLGITEHAAGYREYGSLRFVSGLLPMWDARKIYDGDGSLLDYAMVVRLEGDCTVHIETGDSVAVPLLWSRDIGLGRVVVNNNTLAQQKDGRGLATNAYLALEDTVIYPIINAGMVFIDDFPAPQPEGVNKALLEQFGYDIQGFFRNHWWPDMKRLAWEYGVRYTGVLIETYNDKVTGPFEPDMDDDALIRYYASELLHSGGEMGLHGYNHLPLCPDSFHYMWEDYRTWPSIEAMADGLKELERYASKFLTGTSFKTYVPPSNYLSDDGKTTLLETLPQVRTVSGLYFPETGVDALIQEFQEEADGSISVPRISAGFLPNRYNCFMMSQELLLHGVFSHFIHPDDVLDSSRGGDQGWDGMYSGFSGLVKEIAQTYPALRWSTASEGAAAVQRYDRLQVTSTPVEDGLQVSLSSFYGEAWLAMKAGRPVKSVENGAFFQISPSFYWIRADKAQLRISWEA